MSDVTYNAASKGGKISKEVVNKHYNYSAYTILNVLKLEGKELFKTLKKTGNIVRAQKTVWVAGITAVGAMIGTGVCHIVNKVKNRNHKQ